MTNTVSLVELNAQSATSVWQQVQERLREKCNDYFGLTILDAVGYEGFFDGRVELTVPDELRENWIKSHYGDLLNNAFSEVLGSEYINYVIRIVEPEKTLVEKVSTPVAPLIPRPVAQVERPKKV